MSNELYQKAIEQVKEEMVPALGVTEPAAIALSAAKAYEVIGGEVKKVTVWVDEGVFKNGFSCAIPGTCEKGNEMAAALGVIAGKPDFGLRVLEDVTEEDVSRAKELIKEGKIEIKVKRGVSDIFIDAIVETDKGKGRAVIKDKHTNIVLVEKDGKEIFKKQLETKTSEGKAFDISRLKLKDLIDIAEHAPYEDISFILEAVRVNDELAQAGKQGEGMEVGRGISDLIEEGYLKEDILTYAMAYTGYAVDARMGGVSKPAMSICGSGDHGLVATLPLIAIANKKEIPEEKLVRSILLSYLVTMYIKTFAGRLSAFCGCAVAAGTGSSAGICYLLGGNNEQIGFTIDNMAADITGIICDGGNFGCSLKAVTAASTAILSALLALKNIHIPKDSGIVGNTVEETMQNIGKIASPGMTKTNDVILDIMINRHD